MLHDSLPFKRNLYTEFQPTMIYMPKNGLIFCKTIIFKIHFVIQDLASQVEINTTGSFLKFNFRENCKITDLTLFSQWLYHFFFNVSDNKTPSTLFYNQLNFFQHKPIQQLYLDTFSLSVSITYPREIFLPVVSGMICCPCDEMLIV